MAEAVSKSFKSTTEAITPVYTDFSQGAIGIKYSDPPPTSRNLERVDENVNKKGSRK